jgi:hypothetical protein
MRTLRVMKPGKDDRWAQMDSVKKKTSEVNAGLRKPDN